MGGGAPSGSVETLEGTLAWTDAGAFIGWFIAAHYVYMAFMVGNIAPAIWWVIPAVIFAVTGPVPLHFWPVSSKLKMGLIYNVRRTTDLGS